MLVSKETSQAWKERHDLLKQFEAHQQDLREKLLETSLGIKHMHSPVNIVESRIRALEDVIELTGPSAGLDQMKERLNQMYENMLKTPSQTNTAMCSPVELYEGRIAIVQDAIQILEQEQSLSLSEEDLEGLSQEPDMEL